MANQTEEVKIRFSAETNTQSFKNLQNELDKIQEAYEKAAAGSLLKQQLHDAIDEAIKLRSAMSQAYNVKLNTYNIDTLNQKLQQSGSSLNQVARSFDTIGSHGFGALTSMINQLTSVNVNLNKTETLIDKIGSNMLKSFQWTIYSSISNTILNTIRESVGYVEALDSSLNDIRIVTGKSADEMDRFAQTANKAAQTLGQGTKDYTNASLIYYQQGLSDEDVKTRTDITVKAANVTQQSTAEVSEQLTAVWNGYKVSSQEAELYVDKLAKVAASTAADLEELSTGMSKVASAANTVGVDVDKMNAILATTISVTKQSPETVGVAYKTILARMTSIQAGETAEDGATLASYTEKMAGFGINVLDANNHLREMGEVIEEVGTKWQSMGTRQYNNLMALFENWDMYKNALQESANAAGTLNEQQDIYMESTAAHLQQMRTAAEGVYDSLLDAKTINSIADTLTEILKIVEKLTDGLGGLKGILAQVAPLMTAVFSKQISNTLVNAANNLYFAPKQNKAAIQQAYSNIEYVSSNINQDVLKRSGNAELLSLKSSFLSNAGGLTPESLQEGIAILTKYGEELEKINIKTDEIKTQTQNWNDVQKNTSFRIDLSNKTLEEQITELNKVKTAFATYKSELQSNLNVLKDWTTQTNTLFGKQTQSQLYDIIQQPIDVTQLRNDKNLKKMAAGTTDVHFSDKSQAVVAAQSYIDAYTEYLTGQKSQKEMESAARQFSNTLDGLVYNANKKNDKAAKAFVSDFIHSINSELANKTIDAIPSIQNIVMDPNTSQETKDKIDQLKVAYADIMDQITNKSIAPAEGLRQLKEAFKQFAKEVELSAEETSAGLKQIENNFSSVEHATESLKGAKDNLNKVNIEALVNNIIKVGSSVATAINSFSRLSSSVKTLSSNFSTAEEKSGALIALLPTLISLLTSLTMVAGALQVALWPLLLVAAAIGTIVAVFSAIKQHSDDVKKSLKEQAEESKKLYDEQANLLEQNKKLIKSYDELNKKYKEGQIGLEELRESSYELLKEYGDLDLAIQSLTASEEELNNIMKESNQRQLEKTEEVAKQAYLDSQDSALANLKDFQTDYFADAGEEDLRVKAYKDIGIGTLNGDSFSFSLEEYVNALPKIQAWIHDKNNEYLYDGVYDEIKKMYSENKEILFELQETRDNYLQARAELFMSSIDEISSFDEYQKNRENMKSLVEGILGSEEAAEKYVHDWFSGVRNTVQYELQQGLFDKASNDVKDELTNLSEEELLIINKAVNDFGRTDLLMDRGKLLNYLQGEGTIINNSSKIDNQASLIQGYMESGYQDTGYIEALFKDTSSTGLATYLENARKDIKDFSDFQELTLSEQQTLSNDYYKWLSKQSKEYYAQEAENLRNRKKEIEESLPDISKVKENRDLQETAENKINNYLQGILDKEKRDVYFNTIKENKMTDSNWNDLQNDLSLSNEDLGNVKLAAETWNALTKELEDTEKASNAAVNEIQAIDDALKILEETINGRSLESLNKSLDLFMSGESDKAVKNAKKVLEKAMQEFNKEGDISLDTRQTLLALGPEYYDLWMNEAGAIDFNAQQIKTLTNRYYELMDAEAAEATQKARENEEAAKEKYDEISKNRYTVGYTEQEIEAAKEEYELAKKTREEQEIKEKYVNATTAAYREQLEVIEQFSLSDFNKSVSVIEAAKKEQEQYGQVSSDTIEKLIALGKDYADCWEIVNGQLVIHEDKIEETRKTVHDNYEQMLKDKMTEAGYQQTVNTLTAAQWALEEKIRLSRLSINSAADAEYYKTQIAFLDEIIEKGENAALIFSGSSFNANTSSAKTYTTIESREFHADTSAYDTQIKALQEDLNILRSEAEYLSGEDLNKNLEGQKAIMEEIVSLQGEKLSLSQQEQEVIKKDIEDLTGIKVETDKHGFITNLNALTGSYQSEMKAAADKYNSMITPYGENGVTNAATQKEIEAAKKDYESKKKRYDTLQTYIKEYNTAVSSGKEAEKEIIKIANDEILSQETQRYEAESREIKKMADTYSIAAGSFDKFEKQWSKMSFDERIQSIDKYNKKMEESITLQKQYTENMGKQLTDVLNNGTVDISKVTEGLWNGDLTDISEGAANIYTDYINRRIKELETATDRYEDLSTAEGQEYHSLLLLKDLLVPYAENLEEVNEKTKDLTVSSQTLADAADKYATTSIDRQIERAEKELARVKKQESGLKGNALIANLAKQNSLIQKQIELEKKKLAIIKAQLSMQVQQANAALKDLLANTGITLSLNEDLSNVTEITNALKDMDNLSAESYKLYSEALDKALATYSTYQSIQSEIESLTDEITDNAKKAAEKIKEELSKSFNAKVDVEVNIEDAWRNLHKLRAELDGLKDDDYFGNMNLQLKQLTEYLNTNPNSTLPGGSTQILTQHLQDNYRDQLGSNVQSMMDSVKEMKQTYLSAIDAMISANDKFIQSIDKMSSILNNTMNIIKLVYGDDSYKKMDKYLRMSAQLAMNSATAARNNADNYRARMLSSTTEEEYRKWADAWSSAIDSVYSHAESAIKALSELAENNFKKIAASFTDQWKEIGENGLPLSISWEYEKTKVKDFYDYTNSMYQKDSLSRKIQKAIDEATDPTTINALQDAYANIIGYLDESIKKNKQLSKYEIERANKLYELTLKQMALEDERDNKTKMRLRRDQAGNYRYEYVADDEKVAQSEEDVEKAKNDLYNLAYNRAVSASDSINTYTEQMTKQLSEAAKMYNGDPEQLQAEFKKIYNKYNGLIKAAQNDIALSEQDLKKYGLENDSDFLNVLAHTQNFKSGLTEEQLDQIFGENVNYYEMMRALGVDTEQMAESDMATAQDISKYYQYYADKLADQVDQTKLIVDQLEAMEPMLKSLAETALATYEQSLLLREQEVSAITDANGTGANGASGPNLVTAIDRGGTMDYYKDSLGNKFYDSSIWKEEDAIKFLGPNAKPLDTFPRDGLIHTAVDSGYLTREAAKKNKAAEATNKAKEQANDNATEAAPDLEAIHNEYTAKAIEATKSGGATAGIFHELQGISSMIAKLPLEQHVQIDAQFQGKTKETEIFEALKGLVNRAAQVAENNGK